MASSGLYRLKIQLPYFLERILLEETYVMEACVYNLFAMPSIAYDINFCLHKRFC